MPEAPVVYVAGEYLPEGEAVVSALDRGFTLADGLFETMVAVGDRVFRMGDHMARLREGARLLQLALPTPRELEQAVRETLRRNGHALSVARLTVSRGAHLGRGLAAPPGLRPTVVVRAVAAPAHPPALQGRRLVLSTTRRNDQSLLSRVKSLSYTDAVVARQEAARRGADDALMCNTRGLAACATSSNLFLVVGGALATPPVEDGVLPGIARLTVLEEARRLGMAARERSLTVEEVWSAEEAFLTNVVTGPVPVSSLEDRPIGRGVPGPATERLAMAFREAVDRGLQ